MPSHHRKANGSIRFRVLLYLSFLLGLAIAARDAKAKPSDFEAAASTSSAISKRTDPFVIRMELWSGSTLTKMQNLRASSNMISLTTDQLLSLNIRSFIQSHKSNTAFTGSIQYILRRYNDDNTKNVIYKPVSNTSPYQLCASASCGSIFIDTKRTTTTYVLTATPYSGASGTGTRSQSTTTIFTLIRTTNLNTPVRSPVRRVPVLVPTPIPGPKVLAPLPTNGKWTIIQDTAPITARHESCVAMVKNNMYVIGGRVRAPIDILNVASNTWTTGPEPPIRLHHMQCIAADSKIWIVSAWTNAYPNEQVVDQIYVYNTVDSTWSTRTGLPVSRRRGSAASVLVGRRIYVSHGSRGGHATTTNPNVETVGWLDYYDIDKDTWTTNLPSAPNPRDHTGGALVNDGTMICVAGGRLGAVIGWPDVAATDCYDLTKRKWIVAADLPVTRSGSSYGTTCDGQLIVAGGEGPKSVFNDVHIFDGTTWTKMPNLSRARHGSGLAVDCSCRGSNNKVFLPSGSGGPRGGPLLNSVEAYVVDIGKQSC